MGQDIYVSVLFVTNCFGFFYVLFVSGFGELFSSKDCTFFFYDTRSANFWKFCSVLNSKFVLFAFFS